MVLYCRSTRISNGISAVAEFNELLRKYCPDVLERHELPIWFIDMADSRSKGKLAFIVISYRGPITSISADYYNADVWLETKLFKIENDSPKNHSFRKNNIK